MSYEKQKAPTLKEIAIKAGVTMATVSMALNNTGRISEDTRNEIKRIAEEMSYRPNVIARGLAKQRLKLIGMVVPSFHDNFSHEVFLGVEMYAKNRGYKILVGLTNNQEDEEKGLIEEFLQLQVAGLIVHPSPQFWLDHHMYKDLQKANIPFVFYTRYPREGQYHRVLSNDVLGGKLATKHLIERGHTRIAYYTNRIVKDANDSINKKLGYDHAHREAGLPIIEELSISSDLFKNKGKTAIAEWIQANQVTAIFVSTDYTAMHLMQRLQEYGLKIPDDVAIIGYDDIYMSSMCTPKLSTIRVPKQEIGMNCAEMIVSLIEGNRRNEIQEWICTPELVVREST